MSEASTDKQFATLCGIVRAQHFAWREAVSRLAPDVDPARAVVEMWRITGRDTARAYLRRIDPGRPLAPQVAALIAASSAAMGEQARVEPGASDAEAWVVHTACPWLDWHRRLGLLAEDADGCDAWFQSTVAHLGEALGVRLGCETAAAMPRGERECRRRLRVEGRALACGRS